MKKAPAPEEAKRQTLLNYSIGQSDQNTVNHKHDEAAGGYASLLDSIRTALLEAGIEPANPDALLSRLAEAEGKPVRFGTVTKPRSKNGWLPSVCGGCRRLGNRGRNEVDSRSLKLHDAS
mgnify:CR=1 FL=1